MEMFEIEIIYPITKGLINEDELSDIDVIQLKNDGIEADCGVDYGYWDLASDPIVQINPRAFVPIGKKRPKYYCEVVFQSGNISMANGKPADLKAKIEAFLNK